MSGIDIAQLRALEAAATPGPWKHDLDKDGRRSQRIESADVVRMDNGAVVASLHITAWKQGGRNASPDAAFIAAARTAVPALLAEVERLQAALKRLCACPFLTPFGHTPKSCFACEALSRPIDGDGKGDAE